MNENIGKLVHILIRIYVWFTISYLLMILLKINSTQYSSVSMSTDNHNMQST